ncbi:MAG: tetratricopeptide repeat protein, partial [Chloroflexi bacterium]|nr:tetratricopeptide repeat protein [Chloroflexota bacterium]
LNQAERSYLHEDIARALEAMYGAEVGTVAVLLAWHYTEAGLLTPARTYLHQAGMQASASAAYALAASYFSQALALTGEAEGELRFDLLLAREEAYYVDGQREAERADLDTLETLAATLADPRRQSDAALRRARYAVNISGEYGRGAAAAQQALAAAERSSGADSGGDVARQAAARRWWGEALWRQGEYAAAQAQLGTAVSQARQAGDVQMEAEALRNLGIATMLSGDAPTAISLSQEALALSRRIGDRHGESRNLNNLGYAVIAQGSYEQARRYLEEGLQVARRAGLREGEVFVLGNLATVALHLGDYPQAEVYAAQELQLSREVELRALEAEALTTLGRAHLHMDQVATGLEQVRAGLSTLQEMGHWEGEPIALLALGEALRRLGQAADAQAIYRETLEKAQAHADLGVTLFALAGLAATALDLAAPAQAGEQALALLALLPRQEVRYDLAAPAGLYLAGYRGLAAVADERALAVLQAGYRLLMDTAAKIESEALRRSFLENVPANRELVAACAQRFPDGVPDAPVDLAALFPPPVASPITAEPAVVETAPAEPEVAPGSTTGEMPAQVVNGQVGGPVADPIAAPPGASAPARPVTPPSAPAPALPPVPVAKAASVQVDLSGAGLAGALLNAKNLAGWRLAGADLSRAQLRAADLQHADLRGANLREADLRGADLTGVLYDEQTLWPEDLPPRLGAL